MFVEMNFLRDENIERTNYYRYLGFLSDTHFRHASEIIHLPFFAVPQVQARVDDDFYAKIPENIRLGKSLEYYFAHAVQFSGKYEILLRNHQVLTPEKTTLGELDFILRDKETGEYLHVELAGKIYLYDHMLPDADWGKWVGPDKRDSLVKKLDKLQRRQFPLLRHFLAMEQGKVFLKEKNIPATVRIGQKLCLKVRAYLPPHMHSDDFPYLSDVNIQGVYFRMDDFIARQSKKTQYFLPEKKDWMVDPRYGERWFSFDEILPQVEYAILHKRSPLVWIKKGKTYSRFFIVWW